MVAQIIDGKKLAEEVRREAAVDAAKMVEAGKPQPCLATVLVGDDPGSLSYVTSKQKACAEAGIRSIGHHLPADATQEEVEKLVRELNADRSINGILVQLPMPKQINEEKVLSSIDLVKDVDGFHPINIGRLAQKGREPLFVPCTPAGCILMLDKLNVPISGANAVVLGRSNIVGMPVALLLIRRDATVTICHSRSKDLPGIVRQADILIAAVGRPRMVRGDWVKPSAVVIDVGINRIEDPTHPKGSRLVGDVNFDEVKEVASVITPVPGGVGPMTIAMLLKATVKAGQMQNP